MHHNNSLEVNKTCCKCHYNSVLCECGSLGVQGTVFFHCVLESYGYLMSDALF